MRKLTFGLMIGNRGFFPDHLVRSGREELIDVVEKAGITPVVLSPEESKNGGLETRAEAQRCAALFASRREEIDGVIVSLPNFGDERAVSDALRMAKLDVPVLVQASPDTTGDMTLANRRDSFCGKLSVCNNLRQVGIPYSLTTLHTEAPKSPQFARDLQWFAAVCRVVKGLRSLRIGAIGARPAAFRTVRYSEKILEASGISVETIDLSEIIGRANRLKDDDEPVQTRLAAIRNYATTTGVPEKALLRMARLAAAIGTWMDEADVTATTLQCWSAIEEYYGVVPCTVMSMLSDRLLPCACEVDVCGALSMAALTLASNTPAALLDWNNNYGDDPDKAVCFHCSNLPASFLEETRIEAQAILAGSVGIENAYGACAGRVKPGPITYARFTTDDRAGAVCGYLGAGEFTSDPLTTFGGVGVVRIPRMQKLLRHLCENGLEHHVAASFSQTEDVLFEAATRYLGWKTYWHEENERCAN